jgi:hypothetical protein
MPFSMYSLARVSGTVLLDFSVFLSCPDFVSQRESEEEEEGKEEDAFGGDGGKGLKDPSSTGKRCALKALTTSESNIAGRIENGSLPKKQGLVSASFLGGKENAFSSSSSSSSSMSDMFQRNRLPRRERCSRITSRRRPFVADLR